MISAKTNLQVMSKPKHPEEADGSVIIPEVLRPYMGGLDRISAS